MYPMDNDSIFMIIGTWAMIGCCFHEQIKAKRILDPEISILGLPWKKWGLFYSSVGMWLIQECMRIWKTNGYQINYSELIDRVYNSSINSIIPPNDYRFFSPDDMPKEISNFCHESNQDSPKYPEDYAKIIFDSLALEFKNSIEKLEKTSGYKFNKIVVVGGGSKNMYLNSKMTEIIGMQIINGSVETTAVGNIMLQSRVLNFVENEFHAKDIIKRSFYSEKI
jgi:sugar (pentulose or hexulose) kinase